MSHKYFFYIISIFIFSCSHAQNIKNEDLLNYSYLLTGENNGVFLGSGTGFIIHYIDKYFLVTNFHVLTGKLPLTNKIIPEAKDTNTSIFVIFRPVNKQTLFYPMKYLLFDTIGNRNFSMAVFNNQILDYVVMPIVIPDEVIKHWLEIKDVDTTLSYDENIPLQVIGFPLGQFIKNWQPTTMIVHSTINPIKDPDIFDPFVYFSDSTIRGMSGSPVYFKDPQGEIKLLAINSTHPDSTAQAPKIKGAAIFCKYVVDLIRSAYVRPSITGQFYKGR
ncbi:MAG TPA: hypothetical protein VFE32_13810 [Puia sp.]|jgi:V8-like Glu-specific endopeptidase|nr:hypothetical protein [Puia sp.]